MAVVVALLMVVAGQTKCVKRFRDLLIERHQAADIGDEHAEKISFTHIARQQKPSKKRIKLLKLAFAVQNKTDSKERKTENQESKQKRQQHGQQSRLQRRNHQNLLPPRKALTSHVETDGTITETHMGTTMGMIMEIIISTLVKVTMDVATGITLGMTMMDMAMMDMMTAMTTMTKTRRSTNGETLENGVNAVPNVAWE